MEQPRPHSALTRNLFFVCGIVATLAYRIIVILNYYNKTWVQVAWYIGTITFIIYFLHRYQISQKRARIIKQHNLEAKVSELAGLSQDDKDAMNYIFNTLHSSKEKLNNEFLFVCSIIALIIGIYLDFFAR